MVGKTYRFDMGWLRVRLTFSSSSQGRFVVEEGGGLTPNGHAETVALDLKEIRDGVFLNSWAEACGTTVTHVVDLANATVYANVTVDGTLYNFVGTITEVTDAPVADPGAVGSGQTERTTEIVLTAMRELFAERDLTAVNRYGAEPYAQHSSQAPDGLEMLRPTEPGPRGSTWDLQRIAAQDDLVFTHSIVHGWAPGPVVIVDIFRLEDGRIVEHWDVVQDLVPTEVVPDGAPGTNPHRSRLPPRGPQR
jgi:predicted SnoaL-like aldol condensation-catalyzing enzyme